MKLIREPPVLTPKVVSITLDLTDEFWCSDEHWVKVSDALPFTDATNSYLWRKKHGNNLLRADPAEAKS